MAVGGAMRVLGLGRNLALIPGESNVQSPIVRVPQDLHIGRAPARVEVAQLIVVDEALGDGLQLEKRENCSIETRCMQIPACLCPFANENMSPLATKVCT